ncbi:hypothetical protein N7481_001862 [Penicillium waksmanii]|uniref:uncharacterized protein n=1 Tax=Penicillium waksmanii TaxID=69791 RepID=UPI0025488276|nr:uncharacterized protein N7481_001862 [Penicillium waksmanii]KAJ5994885.1 hypothetical protein N7481_001862 [Penicillium waksmanii]
MPAAVASVLGHTYSTLSSHTGFYRMAKNSPKIHPMGTQAQTSWIPSREEGSIPRRIQDGGSLESSAHHPLSGASIGYDQAAQQPVQGFFSSPSLFAGATASNEADMAQKIAAVGSCGGAGGERGENCLVVDLPVTLFWTKPLRP